MTRYKNFLIQKEQQIKMSSLLNVSNTSNKPEVKNNGISIIAKNNEEYPYISICYVDNMAIEGIRPGCC